MNEANDEKESTQVSVENEEAQVTEESVMTKEDYDTAVAENALDRSKLMMLKIEKLADMNQVDYAIASCDHARAELDAHFLRSLTKAK